MAKDRTRILDEIAKKERLLADLQAGKDVRCETCHLPLSYDGPGSGRHPGIYCATGCTVILMEFSHP